MSDILVAYVFNSDPNAFGFIIINFTLDCQLSSQYVLLGLKQQILFLGDLVVVCIFKDFRNAFLVQRYEK